jgi:hypothetical protein
MQWFRANLKVGARLGLFALTLQIVLSFGHVHLGGLRHSTDRLSVAGTHSVPPTRNNNPSVTRTNTALSAPPSIWPQLRSCRRHLSYGHFYVFALIRAGVIFVGAGPRFSGG